MIDHRHKKNTHTQKSINICSFSIVFCLLNDIEYLSIRHTLFSSLFSRPLTSVSISDDEQMIPFRIYNSRMHSTSLNECDFIHQSTLLTTLQTDERCSKIGEPICQKMIYFVVPFAFIFSIFVLSCSETDFSLYICMFKKMFYLD